MILRCIAVRDVFRCQAGRRLTAIAGIAVPNKIQPHHGDQHGQVP